MLLTGTLGHATPLQIQVLDQQFATYTYSRRSITPSEFIIVSNRITSPLPINDSIWSPTWNPDAHDYSGPLWLEAQAEADLFQVRSYTRSVRIGGVVSGAAAATQVTFSSATAGLATFDFELIGKAEYYYSQQFIGLRDLTLGTDLWSYGYGGLGGGSTVLPLLLPAGTTFLNPISWTYVGFNQHAAHVSVDTFLNTASIYELTLFTSTGSNPPDSEDVQLTWSAPIIVPEPTLLSLLGCGGALHLLTRGRARRL